ncbi:unnamed protein product [Cylicocyclus nassatus]|uniref:Amino acid transporter transmembrane domain-containing protein n=1 Tax=Cylicocyclus nassatus TaxID=53992 RepID=A0AA36H3B7_CYLNA|nr:unnamed protein product [Cylicocyclus nassatus]
MIQDMSAEAKNPGHHGGFSWWVAAIFIVGETAGSGLVAMPNAIKHTGFIGGTILLSLVAVMCGHTARNLGSNFLLMQKRWPQYLQPCRSPYPEMGYRAMGRGASILVQAMIFVTLFGGTSVFCLLASRNISELMQLFGVRVHFCVVLFVLALVLWPFMMLRSPMNFWQVSIGAAASTTIAVILILIGASIDIPTCYHVAAYEELSLKKFCLGFGTIVFAYGGHPAFPTIQHDMSNPRLFPKAALLSYILLFVLYAPVSLEGYAVYGNSLTDSIISSIQTSSLRLTINALITAHVLFSILIIINPLHQAVEEQFKVKHEFSMGRFVVRTVLFFATVIAASLLPNFGVFLDLVGSSSMTLLALVLPGLFRLYLEAGYKLAETQKGIQADDCSQYPTIKQVISLSSNKQLLIEGLIMGVGLLLGILATANALTEAVHSSLASPCFVQLFSSSSSTSSSLSTYYCCGPYRNITSNSDATCSA